MRRIAVTAFILFYTALTLWGSENRIHEWLNQQADTLYHAEQSKGIRHSWPHPTNSETHHRRIFEEHYVVEPLQRTSGVTLLVSKHLLVDPSLQASRKSSSRIPTRAPPSFV